MSSFIIVYVCFGDIQEIISGKNTYTQCDPDYVSIVMTEYRFWNAVLSNIADAGLFIYFLVFLSFSLSLSWIQPCPQPVLLHLGNAPVFIKISVNLPPFLTLCIPNQLINQLINIKQITKHETFSSQHFAPGPKIYCSQKCLVLQLLLWLGSKILVLFTVERIETFFIL